MHVQEHSFQDRYAKRLEEERKVNVYFLQMKNPEGERHHYYVAASAMLHEKFVAALEYNQIPDFAVVVHNGEGIPSDETKRKMKEYYGFDHDVYEKQVEESLKIPRESLN